MHNNIYIYEKKKKQNIDIQKNKVNKQEIWKLWPKKEPLKAFDVKYQHRETVQYIGFAKL